MIIQILKLLGSLAMFLFGMNQMSTGIQKATGDKLRSLLKNITSNPFKGSITGLGITAIIQSSSATTVLVVSFVSAGLLTLTQAIGVIMGANIGTTVTAWIISLFGFKFDIAALSIPLFLLGFIMQQFRKDKSKDIGKFIIGFSLLFLGLSLIKSSVPDLSGNNQVLEFLKDWTGYGFGSLLLFVVTGTVLTLVLQSSSATMAITLIMLSQEWIPFEMGAAMVLGENIGTTITANIAASMGTTDARRAALAHTVFNVFGVIWAVVLFKPFVKLDIFIVSSMGEFSPLVGLAMFHTLFNTINTLVLIWFTPQIEKLVCGLIAGKPESKDDKYTLRYISGGPVATPELGAQQAMLETIHFATISQREVSLIRDAVDKIDTDGFENTRKRLVKYEVIADDIEKEIATFLTSLMENETSQHTQTLTNTLLRIISELESLGDSGECISRILNRLKDYGTFSIERKQGIYMMLEGLQDAYDTVICCLENYDTPHLTDYADQALKNEIAINSLRNRFRDEEYSRIESGQTDYAVSTLYLDIIAEIERMGDYIINIAQAVQKYQDTGN
ncbi:MAG: Na/Pi cotransporter family protein [Bacteroidaceae bacterium]|nr:Na/Pi cotransporter family protein [Bacteroidaceae bacterium]